MNDTNNNCGPCTTTPPKRGLSAGSKLRFWKQAYIAALQSGTGAGVARIRADDALVHYNAKFQELFPS